MVQRVVVKIGASVLTDAKGRLVPDRLEHLVAQVAGWLEGGSSFDSAVGLAQDFVPMRGPKKHPGGNRGASRQAVLVSSGAIACGMNRLGLTHRPTALAQLQACAAIGQGQLMHRYALACDRHQLLSAQVLLTQEDLSNARRFRNAKQTLLTLLHRRVLPIINENDTVAVEEITFGDNDRLAALVAVALEVRLLIILSDVEGVLQDGRVLDRIEMGSVLPGRILTPHTRTRTKGTGTAFGGASPPPHTSGRTKGGMASKLEAARIAGHSGIPTVIANGLKAGVLGDALAGKPVGTRCAPSRTRLASRKWWLAFARRTPHGALIVDEGASSALTQGGKSLMSSGVREVTGRFESGSLVSVSDPAGRELARGICNFSSSELLRVRGLTSQEVSRLLGDARSTEVIHRDRLVLTREVGGS
jgi:glutamate 5-kinase